MAYRRGLRGTDGHHQDLRPDSVVLPSHQQISPQPSLRPGRTHRTEPLRSAGNADPGQVHPPAPSTCWSRPTSTLEILRFQMRLAKDLQCLKVESYGFAAKAIDEIGKLVGGWLKSGRQGMKRHGNLWEQVISFESLLRAAEKARKGKRFRPAVAAFHFDLERELWKLHEELADEDLPTGSLPQLLHLRTQETADQCRPVPGSGRPPRPGQRAGADLRADVHRATPTPVARAKARTPPWIAASSSPAASATS